MATAIRSLASRSSAFVASPVAPARRVVAVAPTKAVVVEVEAKLKTRKAAAKRFKVTGSGKVMARHAGKQHFNEKMTRDRNRDLSKMYVVSDADIWNATKCLPYHGIGGK
mmetsp:Transcript_6402/g.14244  ORF Transcript_6402/g.14244 Transcript_6402/m.14244 type:complete len:110 (+) Transcript_6402:46-375(+)|eukprot:CAMPEP_0202899804 /NCGR_PEP_ID=MMETSP1392-20130828/8536_1 /ASSEMBLY_ACC=CAM_ASM_000868 /TAXON_ID=225041 /ORGANISM="Chlamydomonas chlamydogama, Strain SAG 11-48b" /LENGTH=109 /DNA_ID=CAMNT_0049586073 /DNA_START=42 /DNA_END=371 /DNA_ORIENTATION=+